MVHAAAAEVRAATLFLPTVMHLTPVEAAAPYSRRSRQSRHKGRFHMPSLFPRAAAGIAAAMAIGCIGVTSSVYAAESLYARLGGKPVVDAIATETIDQVVADPRLNQSFHGSNLRRIKRLLSEQICELAGGGCIYSGDSMREVHAGHHITEAQFYGLVQILRDSMRHHHIGLRERNELLALLAPMKRDIVEQAAPAPKAGS
jgi:hemoglobin